MENDLFRLLLTSCGAVCYSVYVWFLSRKKGVYMKALRIRYGDYMSRLRERGMTQKQVAEAVGVTNRHWSLVVSGAVQNVGGVTAAEAAAVLGMTFDQLWEVVEVPDPAIAPKSGAGVLQMAAAG